MGLKRRGVPRPSIHAMRAAYRAIFLDDEGKMADRVARARAQWGEVAEVREILDFIDAPAKRAIMPGRRNAKELDED